MNKVWKIVISVLAVLLVICLAWPNANKQKNQKEEATKEELAQELFDFKNPYIGDAPADADLLNALEVEEALGAFSIEIQTEEQPYLLRLRFTETIQNEEELDEKMKEYASVLLAMIENADVIEWVYTNSTGESITRQWTVNEAEGALKIEDLKSYSISKDKVEELLNLLT